MEPEDTAFSFHVNNKEYDEAMDFVKSHKCLTRRRTFEWVFTETGIGIAVAIQCKHCGTELNVTDYDTW